MTAKERKAIEAARAYDKTVRARDEAWRALVEAE